MFIIEEESGTYSGRIRHPHNGYFAGDFSKTPRCTDAQLAAVTALHRWDLFPTPNR